MSRENWPRVLVVDDVVDTADTFARLLKAWGYGAEACYEGSAALEAIHSYRPQAVLLDLGMPGMDGFQIAQCLREQPGSRHRVLIAVTGYTGEAFCVHARELGFRHYLVKPIEPDDLRELLIRVIGQPLFSWRRTLIEESSSPCRRSRSTINLRRSGPTALFSKPF